MTSTLNIAVPDWHKDARCAETDPDAFFPEKGQSVAPAKAVCRNCEVQAECRAEALARKEPHGVWGGLSGRERRRIRAHTEGGVT